MKLPLLTASSARAYRTCPRLYELSYERGYRPAMLPDALTFGTLGHRGLDAWWRAAQTSPGEPDAWWSAALAELDREHDPFQRARALSLMWGYHARWQGMTWQDQPIRVVGVEVEFRGPLLNPTTGAPSKTWERAGKLDVLVEVGGAVYVVEHKTTSEDVGAGADYWQRLGIDAQASAYLVGARLLGYEPVGLIYDLIRKPGLAPLKATPEAARKYTKPTAKEPARLYAGQRLEDETPEGFYERVNAAISEDVESYYARGLVVRLDAEEREAALDLWQTGGQIRDARRLRAWPRNADACVRFGRKCDFFGVCTGVKNLEDPTRFRRAARPHEELAESCPAVAVAAE